MSPTDPRSARSRPRRRLRIAALVLLAVGIGLVGAGAGSMLWGIHQQQQLTEQWQALQRSQSPDREEPGQPAATPEPTATAPSPAATRAPARSVPTIPAVFAMRVPKLGYYAAVVEGIDVRTLFAGPGHYPSTPMPGQVGNVGIAAHNSYWLGFDRLVAGDRVVIETRTGTINYVVTGTRVVKPDDRTVLVSSTDHRLTMTTCWPLWAGALAPDRYVIFATQV